MSVLVKKNTHHSHTKSEAKKQQPLTSIIRSAADSEEADEEEDEVVDADVGDERVCGADEVTATSVTADDRVDGRLRLN